MARLAYLLTIVATLLFPVPSLAGEIAFSLPLHYWSMASCTSPGKDTSARCSWQANNRGGVGINCLVKAQEDEKLSEITLDIDILVSGIRPPNTDGPGLRKFAYDFAGIGCWAYVPSGMDKLACRVRSNGFSCNWCNGSYCYAGHANLSRRTVELGTEGSLALANSNRPQADRD